MSKFKCWDIIVPHNSFDHDSYLIISVRKFTYGVQYIHSKSVQSMPKHWIDAHYYRSLSDILKKL